MRQSELEEDYAEGDEWEYFPPIAEVEMYRAVDLFWYSEEDLKKSSWQFILLMIWLKGADNEYQNEMEKKAIEKSKLEQQRLKHKN